MQFYDIFDFDPKKPDKSNRSWWGEVQTEIAHKNLVVTPYKVNS